jgi:hypothetical protein
MVMPTPQQIHDWVEFLEENGCKGVIDFGDWVMCNCPFHEQEDFTRPSFGINKESGAGNCFGCGKKSWQDICELFDISSTDFIEGIKENAWGKFMRKVRKEKGSNKFLRFKLPNELCNPFGHKGARDWARKRGISKEIMESCGVRLCMDKTSKYYEHIIFPIKDEKGVLYFDARYVGKLDKPRWRAPKKSNRLRTFYGWRYKTKFKYLVFVEGAGDVLKMKSMGLKNTIAAKNFSDKQFDLIINSGVRYIFLAYDNDDAGRYKTSEKTGKNISFNAKAKSLFSNAGIYIAEVEFPKGCNDSGDIKSESQFFKMNPKLNKFKSV